MDEFPLHQLPTKQLEIIKKEIDQVIDTLLLLSNQLSFAHKKVSNSLDNLRCMKVTNRTKEMLIPITRLLYVPGHLDDDVETVLVEIGSDYYVEKSTDDAEAYFLRRIEFMDKQLEKLQNTLLEKQVMQLTIMNTINEIAG